MAGFKTKLIVAAIDFGTTYSGYAYSFRDEYKKDPLKIYANADWSDGSGLITLKAPTVVLFDKTGKFDSFGYEAENKYAALSEEEEHYGWKYFRRFKMALDKANLRRGMQLEDDQGKRMKAIDVFAAAIGFLKDHLLQRLKDRISEIKATDIHWVLTVPAIWEDPAKQFMQEAASEAGIPSDQLELALEPEAAAIYVKELNVAKAKETGKQAQLKTFDAGAQFMVLDLGGGTIDISCHEVQHDSTLKGLSKPSGGPWGGTLVDRKIYEHLEVIFGKEVFDDFRKTCKAEDLELQRVIELKKRKCTTTPDEKVILSVPSVLYDIFGETSDVSLEESLRRSIYQKSVTKKRGGKLQFDASVFHSCFQPSKESLLQHVSNLLRLPQLRKVKTLMMVGGFSESEIIRTAIKNAFQQQAEIIIPEQGEVAVVKGAVMYGHNTKSISSRILPHTYGISTAVPFNVRKHPDSKKVFRDGYEKCEDVFKIFIQAGETVVPGQTKFQYSFTAPFIASSRAVIEIYRSKRENPSYVTDPDCCRIGEVIVTLYNKPIDQKQLIDVTMWFGDTTLHVEAQEHGTYSQARAEFNFLR